jgi:alcohol dehydrogenase class IV
VWSGLDALTQNVEAYLSRRATPMTDLFSERGMRAATIGLVKLTKRDDVAAREPMALAALLSGLALANGGLGRRTESRRRWASSACRTAWPAPSRYRG